MSSYGYNTHFGSSSGEQQPHQLTPLSNLSTRPYQVDSPGPPQTLPPLHPHNGSSYSASYQTASAIPSSRTPQPPQSRAETGPSDAYAQTYGRLNTGTSQVPSLFNPSYASQPPSYAPTTYAATTYPTSSTGYGSLQALSSAAGQYSSSSIPGQYPLPALSSALSVPIYKPDHHQLNGSHNHPPPALPDSKPVDSRVMPVVGSQGRRGVIPSVGGSVNPVAQPEARAAMSPQKNADGKYPCVYCNKTYLHLKHLKRHHLRHTGERPYMCVLCNETFCRSDILKRHFIKCSQRRGNPSGLNHLSHAQAHLRQQPSTTSPISTKASAKPNGSVPAAETQPTSNYRSSWHNGTANFSQGYDQPYLGNGFRNESNASSRSSSIMRPASSNSDDKKRFSGTNSLGSNTNSFDSSPSNFHISSAAQNGDGRLNPYTVLRDRNFTSNLQETPPASYYNSGAAQPFTMPPLSLGTQAENTASYGYARSSVPQYHGTNNEDWASYFQPNSHDPLMFTSE